MKELISWEILWNSGWSKVFLGSSENVTLNGGEASVHIPALSSPAIQTVGVKPLRFRGVAIVETLHYMIQPKLNQTNNPPGCGN